MTRRLTIAAAAAVVALAALVGMALDRPAHAEDEAPGDVPDVRALQARLDEVSDSLHAIEQRCGTWPPTWCGRVR